MSVSRMFAWGFTVFLFFIPLNWVRLWSIGELPPSSQLSVLFAIATVLWLVSGSLAYFLVISARGIKRLSSDKLTSSKPLRATREECTLTLTYVDEDQNETTRNIRLYKSGATNRRFHAWCSLRREKRTFLFERIRGGVDLETGEILSRADIFRLVHPSRTVPVNLL